MAIEIEKIDIFWKKLEEACEQCGRDMTEVTPVIETDKFDSNEVSQLIDGGFDALQETKLYKAEAKVLQVSGNVDWHYMGKIKDNQIAKAVRMFSMIHFVGSMELLKAIDDAAGKASTNPMIALEANVAGAGGTGFLADELHEAADFAAGSFNITFSAISGKPPLYMNSAASMKYYHQLALLKSQVEDSAGLALGLSMGRSDRDLDAAVATGCNWIRGIL
jgi:uncharacterized pyridoxal phosphate-containing UPF0001 family protein